jgi:hypothetical protein
VSSRGEAERFLYYDGPTLARTPVIATLADGADGPPQLKLRVLDREHEVFPMGRPWAYACRSTRPKFQSDVSSGNGSR